MASISADLHFLQQYQRRRREIWLNRLGKEFHTCWLPVLDICHIVADYLIHYPHQFDAAIMCQSDNSDAIIANDRLSVQFKEIYSGVMSKWPIWKTSPTINFKVTRMLFDPTAWIGLCTPDFPWRSTLCYSGQWLISKDGNIVGDRNICCAAWNSHLQFKTNDVITIKCDFDGEKVYFSKNKSKKKHLIFKNLANLQSLHFCVEGCLIDFAIEESDAI